jgi:hypothetical protein
MFQRFKPGARRAQRSTSSHEERCGGCVAEPLEERVLMAMSLRAGGSGYSNLLATDSTAVRQQKLIIDPPEPLAGSTSTLYDASRVTLVGALPGPGYENQSFGGFVEVRIGDVTRLQPLDLFLRQPAGVETGYVQIHYQLSGQAGLIQPPRDWLVLDVGGTEGADTHELDFVRKPDAVGPNAYRVYAAKEGEHSGNAEDFLLTNDGTRTRLGPDQLSSAEATTAPKDGSVSGTVFFDFNGDGVMNGDDRPLGDVTVYVDVNGDGRPGIDEPTTKSNELGGYFFDNLAPGEYEVREVPPQGLVQTSYGGGPGRAIVRSGQRYRFVNFGNARPATISGTVFNDLNDNGVRDATEPALAGAAVYLDLNNNGVLDAGEPSATSADPAGDWSISGLTPGNYVVRQNPPTGFVQTMPATGGQAVTVGSGGVANNVVFGDYRLPGPKVLDVFVRGSKWSDAFLKKLAALRLGEGSAGFHVPSPAQRVTLLPWVNVDEVAIRFDQPVAVDAADLVIQGTHGDYKALDMAPLTGMANTYLFVLNRPLGGDGGAASNGDRLLLDLNGDPPDGVRAAGAAAPGPLLDGDFDGIPGGDFRLRFNVVQGDVDHTGTVNVLDYLDTLRRRGSSIDSSARYSVYADLDGNGGIDVVDALLLRRRIGSALPAVQAPAAAVQDQAPMLQPMRRGLFGDAPAHVE